MKKILILFFIFPTIIYAQNDNYLDSLYELFREDIQWLSLNETVDVDYRQHLQDSVLSFNHILRDSISSSLLQNDAVLIIAEENAYSTVGEKIKRYAFDIHYALEWGAYIETISGGDHTSIKSLICTYDGRIRGVIFIGKIVAADFELWEDGSYSRWPCDLYYMDTDGQWIDSDSNGYYDMHLGNVEPEIFVSHITGGDEDNRINNLSLFFDKDHEFWTSSTLANHCALSYINHEWMHSSMVWSGIQNLYDSVVFCTNDNCDNFSLDDYISKITSDSFSFVHLVAHSSPLSHTFTNNAGNDEYLYRNSLKNLLQNVVGYNLYCCSACNWVYSRSGCIGDAYLYNPSKTLVVVGTTKTGGMLNTWFFYQPLSQSYCVGDALKIWWHDNCRSTHSTSEIHWYYGMTILGDPLIRFAGDNTSCVESISLQSNNNETSNVQIYKSSEEINIQNFNIPNGKTIRLDAPTVKIESDFFCPTGSSVEISEDGCTNNLY